MDTVNRIEKGDSLQRVHLSNQLIFRGPAVRVDRACIQLHAVLYLGAHNLGAKALEHWCWRQSIGCDPSMVL